MDKLIRVLIVDDSAYIRKVMKKMLSRSPFIEVVGTASDGEEALELTEKLNPDVVTLDIVMPQLDGVSFLRTQMAKRPVRVVMVSITSESSELVLEALNIGAIDFVHKPTSLATDQILEIADELIAKVKEAANVDISHLQVTAKLQRQAVPQLLALTTARLRRVDMVVLGISTGGPQALRFLIPQLPANFPVPLAMVLHMPVGYTKMYAEKLNQISAVTVVEAQEGDELRPGVALLAPAGRHLRIVRHPLTGAAVTHLDLNPSTTPHRPCVDVLFQSASEVFRNRLLGIVMTGMGSDGKQGAAWIKSQGGVIFTEAEESCVVYGMPMSVYEAGLSDKVVPLAQMSQRIMELV